MYGRCAAVSWRDCASRSRYAATSDQPTYGAKRSGLAVLGQHLRQHLMHPDGASSALAPRRSWPPGQPEESPWCIDRRHIPPLQGTSREHCRLWNRPPSARPLATRRSHCFHRTPVEVTRAYALYICSHQRAYLLTQECSPDRVAASVPRLREVGRSRLPQRHPGEDTDTGRTDCSCSCGASAQGDARACRRLLL
jgi:hypothetical protein